ncbi:MAG: glycoside hydrolase family 99-like domain-containing protein, partial [Alphaproteobacteria bacterium]|nr:glycoside hydrolase family 99-like domain-containing protein [Alphaproteobacteria bacterium]
MATIIYLRARKLWAKLLKISGIIGAAEYREIRAEIQSKIKYRQQDITSADMREFLDWALNHHTDKSHFVPLASDDYVRKPGDPKIIAYYLPQFYQFPLNDEWHGRGFTEWTNCAHAMPQFIGHHQPRVPIDVGFYNLETTHIMRRQIELAKKYGIFGFCFYYYWFSGDKIMEKPINNFLADKSLDMPFCLFWANENWTQTWGEAARRGEKVFDASVKDGDAVKFVADIMPFWADPRYIKIDGRPVLIIYKHHDKRIPEFIADIKRIAKGLGAMEPYVMMLNNHEPQERNPIHYNADAVTEFNIIMQNVPTTLKNTPKIMNPLARFRHWDDAKTFIETRKYMYETDYPLYRGCFTTFDDTARKIYGTGARIIDISPTLYQKWLTDILKWTRESNNPEKLVFVSAWNEWAEAMHLEPDSKNGYAYLDAT